MTCTSLYSQVRTSFRSRPSPAHPWSMSAASPSSESHVGILVRRWRRLTGGSAEAEAPPHPLGRWHQARHPRFRSDPLLCCLCSIKSTSPSPGPSASLSGRAPCTLTTRTGWLGRSQVTTRLYLYTGGGVEKERETGQPSRRPASVARAPMWTRRQPAIPHVDRTRLAFVAPSRPHHTLCSLCLLTPLCVSLHPTAIYSFSDWMLLTLCLVLKFRVLKFTVLTL
jgi:hypothetical protein